ncbi:MAG: hypothetical protein WCH61_03825 [bacterium]
MDDQFRRGPVDAVRLHLLVRGHILKLTHHCYGAMYWCRWRVHDSFVG